MSIIIGVLEEGLIYAIMTLGVYITYKILDFPDLSVDGTFPMGAALTAALILNGLPPVLTLLIAFLAGALAGIITGLIHVKLKVLLIVFLTGALLGIITSQIDVKLKVLLIVLLAGALVGIIMDRIHVKLKVRDLLSGIIVMTALYSINLRIAGKANLPIFSKETIFDNNWLNEILPEALQPYKVVIILLVIVVICKVLLDWYLQTRSGYLLRAVGDNEVLITSLAKDKGVVKIVGLAIANGFAALAGCVYCQQKGFFEISIGTGTMVFGLASVIIGTKVFNRFSFLKATTSVVFGSIVYKACVSIAIAMGMAASDLKLITSILFLLILVLSDQEEKKVKTHA